MKVCLLMLFALGACGPAGVVRGPGFDTSDPADNAPEDTGDPDTGEPDTGDPPDTDDSADTEDSGDASPCAADAVLIDGSVCMDRYEAPNVAGADPLVMLTFVEAEAWCGARGKRLCYDDEWQRACEGSTGTTWPYGNAHEPGRCNDEETWRVYSQSTLSKWPYGLPVTGVDTLDALLDLVRAEGPGPSEAADHVAWLYQAEGSGTNTGCASEDGVMDLLGNVEEWTRRSDGGTTDFHGNLKGRYWSEPRTCQSNLTTHGDQFRFYEIGFRCCADPGE